MEHNAMEKSAKNKDLLITNTDKGRAVVIMDTASSKKQIDDYLSKQGTNNSRPNIAT